MKIPMVWTLKQLNRKEILFMRKENKKIIARLERRKRTTRRVCDIKGIYLQIPFKHLGKMLTAREIEKLGN